MLCEVPYPRLIAETGVYALRDPRREVDLARFAGTRLEAAGASHPYWLAPSLVTPKRPEVSWPGERVRIEIRSFGQPVCLEKGSGVSRSMCRDGEPWQSPSKGASPPAGSRAIPLD